VATHLEETTLTTPSDVLDLWFGPAPAATGPDLRARFARWFDGDAALARDIAARLAGATERAIAGELHGWAEEARGCVALVLLLDQCPRNLYRDSAGAFAGDERAQQVASSAFERGLDRELTTEQRLFLILPFVHAEHLAMQERGVVRMHELVAAVPEPLRPLFGMGIEQANKYRGVISRFGRFPQRNQLLGRASTADEVDLLREWKEQARWI